MSRSMGSDICRKCMDKGCLGFEYEITECESFVSQTNADCIRAMTDEELARRIAARTACMDCILLEECNRRTGRRRCVDMWLDWLKSPASEVPDG